MTGRIIGGSFVSAAGLGSFFFGAMFLIASGSSSSRLVPGFLFLTGGTVMLILGIRLLVKGIKQSPGNIEKLVRAAAAKHNGEIPEDVLLAETGGGGAVEAYMEGEIRKGNIRRVRNNDGISYVFPSLQFTLQTKYCPYCGRDYPVRESIETCPTCGGDLKLKKTGSSEGGGLFSMDT